jgi:glycosyltransferase involved in cell wall biosynthesis
MMRVLQTAISLSSGGRSVAIRTLVNGLNSLGVRNDLCCLDELGCEQASCTGLFGRLIELRRQRLLHWRALREMIHCCDECGIQVIHAHGVASMSVGALVRLARPHIKLVVTFHRSMGHDTASFRDKLRNSLSALLCQTVVVGSRERRDFFTSQNYIPKRKVIRIPFGIDVDRFSRNAVARREIRQQLGVDDRTLLLGACGHFGEEKGIDVVLLTFRELLSRLPSTAKIKLVVLGTGRPDRQEAIQSIAAQLPPGRTILTGFCTDRERWFSAMDIFVHAPRLEAFGLVLPEAMAIGLPVVATAVGGITDIVRDGITGLHVASEDVLGLTDSIQTLCDDYDLRKRMSANAQEVARREYSTGLYARRYLELYNAVLAGRRPEGVLDDSIDCAPNSREGDILESSDQEGFRPPSVRPPRAVVTNG